MSGYTAGMKRAWLVAANSVAILGLSACGDHLGEYRLEDVRLVGRMPENESRTFPASPYSEHIRLEVSSTTNLNRAETGAGLYSHVDFCPFHERYRLTAFGPVALDGRHVESWEPNSRVKIDGRDGRYHYLVYIATSSRPRNVSGKPEDQIAAYDLRRQSRSICLRFDVPGYNIIPSQSAVLEVPAELLSQALSSHGDEAAKGR